MDCARSIQRADSTAIHLVAALDPSSAPMCLAFSSGQVASVAVAVVDLAHVNRQIPSL